MDISEIEKKQQLYSKEIKEYNKLVWAYRDVIRRGEILISVVKNEIRNNECSIHAHLSGSSSPVASLVLSVKYHSFLDKILIIFGKKPGHVRQIDLPVYKNGLRIVQIDNTEVEFTGDRNYLIYLVSELNLKVVKSNQQEMVDHLSKAIESIKVFSKE